MRRRVWAAETYVVRPTEFRRPGVERSVLVDERMCTSYRASATQGSAPRHATNVGTQERRDRGPLAGQLIRVAIQGALRETTEP